MKKPFTNFEPIQWSAKDVSQWILHPKHEPSPLTLKLPEAAEILSIALKNPESFVASKAHEGIGLYPGFIFRDQGFGFSDKREFKSHQECLEYIVPLYRRFLNDCFPSFLTQIMSMPELPVKEWVYEADFVTNLLAESLRDGREGRFFPQQIGPSSKEVAALLKPHVKKFERTSNHDGSYIEKVANGYDITYSERGQLNTVSSHATLDLALEAFAEDYSKSFTNPWGTRFENLNYYEFTAQDPV